MKQRLLFNFFCVLFILFSYSQIFSQTDPFGINETGPITVKSQDVFLLWMEDIGSGNYKSYQKIYRYKTNGIFFSIDSLDIDTMLTKTSRREDSRSGNNLYVDATEGRLNVDLYDDVVSIWRSTQSTQKIEIMISHFDTTGFFTNSTATTLDAGEELNQSSEIYVRTGNFDSDSTDEFIIVFRDLSDSVLFYVYDVDSTLQTTLSERFSNTMVLGSSLQHFVKNIIETADLNGDGIDEVISCSWENPTTTNTVPITIKIYSFENGSITPKGSTTIDVPKDGPLEDFIMAEARGQFDDDSNDELVFSAVQNSANTLHISYHYILNVSSNLGTISVGPRQQYNLTNTHTTNNYTEFGLAAGDLNNTVNKRDEVVFAAGNRIRVIAVTDNYTFDTKALINVANGGNADYAQSNNYLKVSDMNMDNREDILIVKNIVNTSGVPDGFEIAAITFSDTTLNDGTDRVIGRILGEESQNDVYQKYAIAVGNFDGFDFTIGWPEHSNEYDISQPIVILNAPPVHFDMFDGNIFDINGCYNGGDCDFWALYKKQTTSSIEVSTKVNKDWVISAGLSFAGQVTVAPAGVGIAINYDYHLLKNYGRHFSLDSTNVTTVSVSVEVEAREDDRIYTTVTDYDVWEYPVFHGNEPFPRNTFLTFVPNNVQGTWFGSKNYIAQNYIPDHEVSNILSYYPYDTLVNNPNLSQPIRASYTSDRFSLDGSSSYNWNLSFSDFQSSQADTTIDNGLDIGYTWNGIGRFDGDFGNKDMITHKTSVSNLIDLKVHLGNVNMGIGQVEYAVTPYAYWGKNDALVVDYAVDVPEPAGEDSWWELKYKNNSDPTFILPWRLDPEKGFSLSEPSKRFHTKDISFIPRRPLPGDTLNILVQVRNFSLIPTPSSVVVKFYLEDPDSGGTPIVGVNGTNTVSTNGNILSLGKSNVEFKWVVLSGLPSYPRIYAVLDQDNTITEIHENNNKGFNIMGGGSATGVEDENYFVPDKYMLYQSYPNPFNPSTTIKYSIPQSAVVRIKIFDILGREVEVLVDEYKTTGSYQVVFNATKFASGVYFYQLRSGDFVETKKMVLMK